MKTPRKILIIYAHPAHEKSRVNKAMILKAKELQNVDIHDLYDLYPDFHIDVKFEQDCLRSTDMLILQFPIYWYSSPSIIKEWKFSVLQYGFAHGPAGTALKGKPFMLALSTAGLPEAYQRGGINHFTIDEFLRPFEQTAAICGMPYWPPFLIQGAPKLSVKQIKEHADSYNELLLSLGRGTHKYFPAEGR